jgi:hypothetical protein
VRDNVRDIETPEDLSWWGRDGLTLFVDLLDSDDLNDNYPNAGEFTSVNGISYTAAPQHSSPATVTLLRIVDGRLIRTQDPVLIDGLSYAFRDAADEFGGEADYTIEGKIPWETLMRFQLPSRPGVETEMGFSWILLDPDGPDTRSEFGGQLQCWGLVNQAASYSTWVFSDKEAGPPGTAVEEDAWGRIKMTFTP